MSNARAILCGGAPGGDLPLDDPDPLLLNRFGGAGANVRVRIDGLRRELAADIADQFLDLLDIAAYVYAGEQAVGRGPKRAADMGERWRRELFFRVPVRLPDVWRDPETARLLAETLSFLSDDTFRFDFRPMPGDREPYQRYFGFNGTAYTDVAEEVVLFSGGLDSLGGAVEESVGRRRRVLLLSHRPVSKVASPQTRLAAELARAAGDRAPFHVPVWVNKAKAVGGEFTQRSRSFLYASLGAAVAATVGLGRLRFYENGVISFNLPLSPQVIGGRATRTTHPKVLAGFAALFGRLAGRPFAVENPFLWRTKTDVVKLIGDAGLAPLVADSVSCAHTWDRGAGKTHCGDCSQCIDRRFAVLAAGLEAHDPAERYGIDLCSGARLKGGSRLLLAGYLDTVRKLRRMAGPGEFVTRYGLEAMRAAGSLPGPPAEALARVFELCRRHACQIQGAIEAAVRRHAAELTDHQLPASCMLRQALDPPRAEGPPAPGPADVLPGDADHIFRRHGGNWVLRFRGGPKSVLPNSLGLTYLRELLAAPGRAVAAIDLARHAGALGDEPVGRGIERSDAESLRAYDEELRDLDDEIAEAKSNHDVARHERLAAERHRLAEHVSRDAGVGGKSRRDGDDLNNLRARVGNAIRRTIKTIGDADPDLGEHLSRNVTCGIHPRYDPPDGIAWAT